MENQLLFFFCALGVFNGFLVSLYLLFFTKQKRIQNLFLGLLVLLLSIRIGKSLHTIFTPREDRNLLILQVGLSACFLIGVSLFYYLKSSVENTKKITSFWKIHFVFLLLVVVVVGLAKPYPSNSDFWNTYFVKFIYTVWGIYVVISGFVLKDIFKKVFKRGVKCTIAELWLFNVYIANVLIYVAYIIGFFYFYYVGTLTFSFVFYGLLFFLLFKSNRDNVFKDIPEKYAFKKIESEEAVLIIEALENVMQQKELYKNTNTKLNNIAKELHISAHKLSQILNDNLGKSFAQYINEYRVEEAKKLIAKNSKYTLEVIGYEAGFSSRSTFYATFKKITGITPAAFRDSLT
ncbi:AraC family transcriptional regulator [Pontimicrobium aquaticum]|uniref:Helix-turn-helix domain-containing protein n=1 Tax=Pontimicrobium aquaticum TaxID=2565367 RepID=A0A4U0EWL6_9FLAO|nr:helix-turn-helix domain-containing protein [Pontimicrobium aquaticum]TJY36168.1 helix-turn-helix domain-containing protein [Pontimicrobium aquaticum]